MGDEYDMDRLRELVETDKDGRHVVLPCKIGATVYVITTQSDDFCGDRRVVVQAPFRLSLLNDIGKRVFLTYEEAVSAIKPAKHGKWLKLSDPVGVQSADLRLKDMNQHADAI